MVFDWLIENLSRKLLFKNFILILKYFTYKSLKNKTNFNLKIFTTLLIKNREKKKEKKKPR